MKRASKVAKAEAPETGHITRFVLSLLAILCWWGGWVWLAGDIVDPEPLPRLVFGTIFSVISVVVPGCILGLIVAAISALWENTK